MQISMGRKWNSAGLLIVWLALAASSGLDGQDAGCRAPAPGARLRESNIFSEAQEADLGEAMSEHLQRNFRVSNDEKFIGYLQRISDRLLKHMPATKLRVQLFFVDLPNANAFNLPGGRVYVSLKLIALARNEDELAGVLAHEFGHMVAHQSAADISVLLKRVVKVTEVSDRRDIFDKYHQLIEIGWRKPGALGRTAEEKNEEQLLADRLALYAVAGAGYSMDAFPEVFDRIAETKGKKGNWLTDFFGSTTPGSKRLREMIKISGAMPPACVDRSPKAGEDYFKTWQADVIENLNWRGQELLHGVLRKTRLEPPLRGEIHNLKFSPDGRYILAQDEGNIYVLTQQPFKTLFQIDAPDALPAQFSPDSKYVSFHNRRLRVETWDVAAARRTSVHELVVQKGCQQADLSPDARALACLEFNADHFDLVVFDVASGSELLRSQSFVHFAGFGGLNLAILVMEILRVSSEPLMFVQFSPDGRYLLALSSVATRLIDMQTHKAVAVPGALEKHLRGEFAFLGTNRVIAVNPENPAKSHVLAFPSGQALGDVSIGKATVATATRGDYLMLRPVEDYDVGVIDVATGKHLFARKEGALDIFDQVFVAETRGGEVALFNLETRQPLAVTSLPKGRFGALKARALSPDWKWLAASEERRGGVWNLDTGIRLYHIRGYQGAYFSDDGRLFADFPKYKEMQREIASVSLTVPQISDVVKIEEKYAQQYGGLLVLFEPEGKSGWGRLQQKVTWEVEDVRSGAKLWSRYFPKEAPSMDIDPREETMVLCWDAASSSAKEEAKTFPEVSEAISSRKERATAFLAEVLEARTGKVIGAAAVEAGGRFLSLQHALASREWLAIPDRNNRILLYSLSTGKEVGRFFGSRAALSTPAGLLCVENEPGHLTLYDINTGQDLDRWVFASPIALLEFSADGKRLMVLSNDQTAYFLDVSSYKSPNIASAGTPAPRQP